MVSPAREYSLEQHLLERLKRRAERKSDRSGQHRQQP